MLRRGAHTRCLQNEIEPKVATRLATSGAILLLALDSLFCNFNPFCKTRCAPYSRPIKSRSAPSSLRSSPPALEHKHTPQRRRQFPAKQKKNITKKKLALEEREVVAFAVDRWRGRVGRVRAGLEFFGLGEACWFLLFLFFLFFYGPDIR